MPASVETTASAPPRGAVRKILVVDLGFLGDTIHLVPALQELRRNHGDAQLQVVTTPVGAEVLRLVACVDRIWEYPLGRPSPPWWRHLGLQWRLARERFDLALNFSGADRTLFVTALAMPRCRFTRDTGGLHGWKRLLAGRVVAAPSRALPVFEQRRQVLAAVGHRLEPARFDLKVPFDEAAWAEANIPRGAVHLSINASSPFKEWPVQRWVELAHLLLERNPSALVATGSAQPREQARLANLADGVKSPRLRVIAGRLSIGRLAAVLERCAVHVGTDSGVTHLGMALGRSTVSVFREYAGLDEWRPRGPGHFAVTAPCGCVDRPAMKPECETCGTAVCLAEIPASRVARLVIEALGPRP